MRKSVATVVFALGVLLVSVTNADGPAQVKVLGSAKVGAAGRLASTAAPAKIAAVPPVPPALRASVVSGVPKSASKPQTFSLSGSQLRAPAQSGMSPSLLLIQPTMVSSTAVFLDDRDSSLIDVWGIPPGSWFVDCTLGEVDSTPFSVAFGDGSVTPSVDTVTPSGGHLVLGLVVKTKGRLQLSRTKAWATTGCTFEAI